MRKLSKKKSIGNLLIVGSGFIPPKQMTIEARDAVVNADIVYFGLINVWGTEFIKSLNSNAIDLTELFRKPVGYPVAKVYREVFDEIMKSVRSGKKTCFVSYGHPTFLVDATQLLLRASRLENFSTRILPGINASDCLFADFGIDPVRDGLQMFEATKLLLEKREIDIKSNVVIWQIGIIGENNCYPAIGIKQDKNKKKRFATHLKKYYPEKQPCALYEASTKPLQEPTIFWTTIGALSKKILLPTMSLFIPSPSFYLFEKNKKLGR